jgi:NAD(P)-dependent dehydrogenase (short-subunit alcohol dehydrogenase family)
MGKQSAFNAKVAVVTGGGAGIGREICLYLARSGAIVVAADRNSEGAAETARQIQALGGRGRPAVLDVSCREEMETLINETVEREDRIDYLFNNAGVSVNGEFGDIPPEEWERVFAVNLWAVIYGCYAVYPHMQRQGSGHIINTASLAGLFPGGPYTPYVSSKHAVVGFSQSLRGEARQYGIKVSTLCPGYLHTDIQGSTPVYSAYMEEERNLKLERRGSFKGPETCIGQMMRGVRRNGTIIIAPARQRLFWWLYRLAPAFMPAMIHRILRYLKKSSN